MTRTALPDGTYLDVAGDDPTVGVDSDSGRTARWDAAQGRLVDSAGNVIREVRQRRDKANAAASKSSGGKASAESSRFATLNAFVDQVMRHLSPIEATVWVALFRDTRRGQVSTSNRDLARRTGCSLRAVHDAMQELRRLGLVADVRLSNRKGEPSVYAMQQHPETCVPALVKRTEMKSPRSGANAAPDDVGDPVECGASHAPVEK